MKTERLSSRAGWLLIYLLLAGLSACAKPGSTGLDAYRRGFIPAMDEVAEELREEFPEGEGYTVTTRLKTADSIREKLARRGFDDIGEITDVAGCRLVVPGLEYFPEAEDIIRDEFRVLEKRDYLEDNEGTGYRAVHYLVRDEGKVVEIQVRTRRQDIWGTLSHDWCYKGPYGDNEAVGNYLLDLSRALYARDGGGKAPLPEPPADLPPDFRAAAKDSLRCLK